MNAQDKSTLINEIRNRLLGLECWYVSAGGSYTGASFELAFGKRIPRQIPLSNTSHSEEFRLFEGEANLLVWCSWRLDDRETPLTSSDDQQQSFVPALEKLVGSRIMQVEIERPGWDCLLEFEPFHQLRIFCDHVPGAPSFDGNWDLDTPDFAVYFGPGAKYEFNRKAENPEQG